MNEKFYLLPKEKQEAILHAGYRVFSQNTYKHSPMSEIAAEAGISKSLLFHYFKNKKELYLFLWQQCAQTTIDRLSECGCYEQTDLFESMERAMKAKLEMIRTTPDMALFAIRAFYEKDPAIHADIQESYRNFLSFKANQALLAMDPDQFNPAVDLSLMYREMYWASEGYLWETIQNNDLDAGQLEEDFTRLLAFWKSIYLKEKRS